jgi:cytochrome c biogenesis protein CcmG, thiol:disulfide interchange protein DsbE
MTAPPSAPHQRAVDDPSAGNPSAGKRSVRLPVVLVGAVLALLLALLGWQVASGDGGDVRSELVGRAAPAVTGTALDGTVVDIDRFRGSWVLVNFFATWCVPCIREHPELVEFSERHDADGPSVPVQVISVAFDDNADAITTFFAQRGGQWPVLAEGTGSIALDYGVRGVPESFLVAPNGQVVAVFYGVTADGLDATIDSFTTPATGPTVSMPGAAAATGSQPGAQ